MIMICDLNKTVNDFINAETVTVVHLSYYIHILRFGCKLCFEKKIIPPMHNFIVLKYSKDMNFNPIPHPANSYQCPKKKRKPYAKYDNHLY